MTLSPRARTATSLLLAAWGGALLARPERVVAAVAGHPVPPTSVVRVLGARRLTQQLLVLLVPSPTVARAATGTDVLHALSMLVAASALPEYRRPALTSAAVALAAAVLTAAGVPHRRQ